MHNKPAQKIQDNLVFGEFGGVNPSITDSSTFTFLDPDTMTELFEREIEGCFLYSRHWNPSNKALADALASMEGSEAAQVAGSGMAAISTAILQLCSQGDEIISSRTVYGGTYALFKHLLPRFGITTKFVDTQDLAAVEAAITPNTRVIYCETMSNPLLEIADIAALSKIAKANDLQLVVDNTFTPMIFSPLELGADIVVYSMTKYINGTNDCVAGAICGTKAFVDSLVDVNSGASMLLGPVLDSFRSASILKNMHSLHIRMQQHSRNGIYLAEQLEMLGVKVFYPGLPSHPMYERMSQMKNDDFGYGGMLAIDMKTKERANEFMARMQRAKVGYLAVSLGYFKTLFSAPGSSTSSEIPEDEQKLMGLSPGLVRFSVGLDHNIKVSFARIKQCLDEMGVLDEETAVSDPVLAN